MTVKPVCQAVQKRFQQTFTSNLHSGIALYISRLTRSGVSFRSSRLANMLMK